MTDLKPGESSDYHRMMEENRDLRVEITELKKEIGPLRELKQLIAKSEVWDTWKRHGPRRANERSK
jgi:cell division septum initiation protein DivIVA